MFRTYTTSSCSVRPGGESRWGGKGRRAGWLSGAVFAWFVAVSSILTQDNLGLIAKRGCQVIFEEWFVNLMFSGGFQGNKHQIIVKHIKICEIYSFVIIESKLTIHNTGNQWWSYCGQSVLFYNIILGLFLIVFLWWNIGLNWIDFG